MSDDEGDKPKEKKALLKFEQAPSARSTCKSTQEKIPKGDWRVGMEAWAGGRVSTVWHKLQPFLEECSVEVCTRGGAGKCKHTGHKFAKGDARFVIHATAGSKSYLTLPAAAELLKPLLHEAAKDFKLLELKGLQELPAEHRKQFAEAFAVPAKEMAAFDEQHPASEPDAEPSPKKRKVATPKKQPAADKAIGPGANKAAGKAADRAALSSAAKEAKPAGKAAAGVEPDWDVADEPAAEAAAEPEAAKKPAKKPARGRAKQSKGEPGEEPAEAAGQAPKHKAAAKKAASELEAGTTAEQPGKKQKQAAGRKRPAAKSDADQDTAGQD